MIISSLVVDGKEFDFDAASNVIYSRRNSVGKTTLVRLILYSMGHPIPSTKGIDFSKLSLKLKLTSDNQNYLFEREADIISITNLAHDSAKVFNANTDFNEIESYAYTISEPKIIENILALHYFDQEKGWTLLNRGKTIGGIRFSIESFLEGLGSMELSSLNERLSSLKVQQRSYKQIRAIIKSREEIDEHKNDVDWTSIDEIQNDLRSLQMEIQRVKNSLERLRQVHLNNEKLVSLISDMKVRIITQSGAEERVTKKNIVGFIQNQSLITAQISREKKRLSDLAKKKAQLNRALNEHLSLVDVDSQLDRFNSAISKLSISTDELDLILKDYSQQLKNTRSEIKSIFFKTKIVEKLYHRILSYAKVLGVDRMIDKNSDFIFTSNLKRYSGANLHLLVFAYRLALLKEVQNRYQQTYPIILDSPLSGELDIANFNKMMKLIRQEFSHNQLIIATIYDVKESFDWGNTLTIDSRLLD
ncbi:hypothetical protein [Lacticaseibacillus pantheris]|uniref:hypothetical protein n=1 Tax=Lacticaseibacillus pantheris TaxID=171523 RepID=UPI0026585715|nr:hypothetical protein [Lacticaseibacillus pantheris]WKF84161.1 hypothetical protein QY874_07630 [Lacticaseibacillus pantheris]